MRFNLDEGRVWPALSPASLTAKGPGAYQWTRTAFGSEGETSVQHPSSLALLAQILQALCNADGAYGDAAHAETGVRRPCW